MGMSLPCPPFTYSGKGHLWGLPTFAPILFFYKAPTCPLQPKQTYPKCPHACTCQTCNTWTMYRISKFLFKKTHCWWKNAVHLTNLATVNDLLWFWHNKPELDRRDSRNALFSCLLVEPILSHRLSCRMSKVSLNSPTVSWTCWIATTPSHIHLGIHSVVD